MTSRWQMKNELGKPLQIMLKKMQRAVKAKAPSSHAARLDHRGRVAADQPARQDVLCVPSLQVDTLDVARDPRCNLFQHWSTGVLYEWNTTDTFSTFSSETAVLCMTCFRSVWRSSGRHIGRIAGEQKELCTRLGADAGRLPRWTGACKFEAKAGVVVAAGGAMANTR